MPNPKDPLWHPLRGYGYSSAPGLGVHRKPASNKWPPVPQPKPKKNPNSKYLPKSTKDIK